MRLHSSFQSFKGTLVKENGSGHSGRSEFSIEFFKRNKPQSFL